MCVPQYIWSSGQKQCNAQISRKVETEFVDIFILSLSKIIDDTIIFYQDWLLL
jgi:hypothetical protein